MVKLHQLRKDTDGCLRNCSNGLNLPFQISERTYSFLNINIELFFFFFLLFFCATSTSINIELVD